MESQPVLSPAFVAQALGLDFGNEKTASFSHSFASVTTDSRRIAPGCLFVALQGEKFDGNDFVTNALAQGARGVICRQDRASEARSAAGKDAIVFSVADTQAAYRKLAAAWRARFTIPVVGIAGAVGKTTTKELLTAILGGRWPSVLKTQGSQNGFVGIPMTLMELRPAHGAAVVEIGIDDVGAMAEHLEIVRASCSIVTAIGPEHLEKLRDLDTVAHEESIALIRVAADGGSVALNLDDPYLTKVSPRLRGAARVIGYTLRGAAAPARDTLAGTLSADGRRLTIQGGEFRAGWELALPLPGAHNAANLLGAIAVARLLGLGEAEIEAGLARFTGGAGGRSELHELAGPIAVVCDYYNANPTSTEAGLDLLAEVARRAAKPGKRWACLADMLELGTDEETYHRALADRLGALGIEEVLLFGTRMKWLADELAKRKHPGRTRHFDAQAALAAALSEVRPGDAVLIKGSHSMKMEEVWKPFRASREK